MAAFKPYVALCNPHPPCCTHSPACSLVMRPALHTSTSELPGLWAPAGNTMTDNCTETAEAAKQAETRTCESHKTGTSVEAAPPGPLCRSAPGGPAQCRLTERQAAPTVPTLLVDNCHGICCSVRCAVSCSAPCIPDDHRHHAQQPIHPDQLPTISSRAPAPTVGHNSRAALAATSRYGQNQSMHMFQTPIPQ